MTKQQKTGENHKKKTRRSMYQYPALERSTTVKSRQDYMDIDYVNGIKNKDGDLVIRKLTDKEKEFLNSFYEEYYGANFKHKGKKLHTTKKQRLALYGTNNARNRCLYNLKKGINLLHNLKENLYNIENSNMKYGSMVDTEDDIQSKELRYSNNVLYYHDLAMNQINENLDKFNYYVQNQDCITEEMWQDMYNEKLSDFLEILDTLNTRFML